LITEDVVSVGRVESVFTADDGSRTFTWLPQWGAKSAPINPTSDGAIEPIHAAPALTPKKSGSSSQSDGVIRRNDPPNHEAHFGRELKPNDPSLFLVSGDCFPGKFLSGNQESVEFQSPFFQKSTLPSHWVRGIRVVDLVGGDAVDRATRNRILTLPRMQRKNPPTHLVVARDGDVLRGQLISFDRDQLLLEVRGEVRTLQVKNIAEIVWLEPTPPTDADTDESAAKATFTDSPPALQSQGLYQVILEQGSRVSIAPDRVDAESLSGSHPVLGQCTLPWSNITRLVLGNAIRIDSARSRFGKWKLQNAADPKFVNEGSDQANDAPSDTAQDRLMGQPAPDFDLAKIDGTPCRLADYRGNVLILDFWASWCGPCIQSMPRMLEISREYRDLGVELVLVNVEETEDRVRVFLEKREIMPTVALDTDGSIAKQFAVQAIPQTVVIDRDGTIAKILVGAGEENETELLRVLDELTARQKTK
jgi:peroxiredoxin